MGFFLLIGYALKYDPEHGLYLSSIYFGFEALVHTRISSIVLLSILAFHCSILSTRAYVQRLSAQVRDRLLHVTFPGALLGARGARALSLTV